MREILRLSLPLTAWLAGFSALYALQGLSCSRLWPEALPARPALLLAWGFAVLLQGALLWLVRRDPSPSPTLRATGVALAAAALVATLWTLAPVAFASACR